MSQFFLYTWWAKIRCFTSRQMLIFRKYHSKILNFCLECGCQNLYWKCLNWVPKDLSRPFTHHTITLRLLVTAYRSSHFWNFELMKFPIFLMSNPIFSQNFLFFSVKSCLSDRTHFSNTPSLGANISFFKKTKNKLFLRKTRLHTLQCRSMFEAIQKQFWSNFNKIVRWHISLLHLLIWTKLDIPVKFLLSSTPSLGANISFFKKTKNKLFFA